MVNKKEAFLKVRRAFAAYKRLIENGQESLTGKAFKSFYETNIERAFDGDDLLGPALFDEDKYPALFEELPIHRVGNLEAMDLNYLPTAWPPDAKTWMELAGRNHLARFLLACLWKSMQYQKVKHILDGLGTLKVTSPRQPQCMPNSADIWRTRIHTPCTMFTQDDFCSSI